MNFEQYQQKASKTDQNPKPSRDVDDDPRNPRRHGVIPLLGLVGEVGALLAEYKKLLRDGPAHSRFHDDVSEELGDILWYVANVATKFALSFDEIAKKNLIKTKELYELPGQRRVLFDEHAEPNQQLPRQFKYNFKRDNVHGIEKVVIIDQFSDVQTGNKLIDYAYDDDGFRYHDVLHLTFAACLGWSPRLRDLRRIEHRLPRDFHEVQEGPRAIQIEEAIVLAVHVYAENHDWLAGAHVVDRSLLRHIKELTAHLEVKDRTSKEWNDAVLRGLDVWRELRDHNGGFVRGDLTAGKIEFIPSRGR